MSLLDKAKLVLLRRLLPKDEKVKEELAKALLPKSPHSIWLGWDDVDMGGRRIRKLVPVYDTQPAAGPFWEGEIIRVRSGAGAKTYIYVCVQNSTDGWDWVQIGVST